jgi:RNA polymerase sigma-70 factor (ECF subfamily)
MENHDCSTHSDEELVRLALGDKEYFACIIKRYEAPLARYVRRLTSASAEDVEDTLQDIFIKTYTNLNSFDAALKFSSWVYRIAHNEVISRHRKLSVRPEGNYTDIDDDVFQNFASDIDIEKDIDVTILREQLKSALVGLSEKYQDVLMLRFFEEKDYEEISDILEKPPGTVATLLNRGKKKLREEFISLGYMKDYEQR